MANQSSTKPTYKQLLLDPRWQKKRLEILSRDGFACRYCGDEKATLHVHHVHYDSQAEGPWDYRDTSLVTLCHECHEVEEMSLPQDRSYLVSNIVAAGFWKSSSIAFLADAFSTFYELDEQEIEDLCALIMLLMQSRNLRITKERADGKFKGGGNIELWPAVMAMLGDKVHVV